ncbi:MAG: hypothetical protein AABZ47_15570 [Planctomycetota bacterium]
MSVFISAAMVLGVAGLALTSVRAEQSVVVGSPDEGAPNSVGPLPAEFVPSPEIGPNVDSTGGVAGSPAPGAYLLVSSFQCNQLNPFCQPVNAVLRYKLAPVADLGKYDGVHVSNVNGPYGLAIHPIRRSLLVVSRPDNKVYEYNLQTGALLGTFISAGSEGLNFPQNILFRTNGNVLLTSTETNSAGDKINGVLEFDGTTGQFVSVFVNGGSILYGDCVRPPQFPNAPCLQDPAGMVWGPNGNLFVASMQNHVVIEYNGTTGVYVGHFDSSKLVSPNGLLVRPAGTPGEGNVCVTSKYRANAGELDKVVEFDKNTRELVSANGGVLSTGFENPGPLGLESSSVHLISDRLFFNVFPNYSDWIRRHNFTPGNGSILSLFTRTNEPFLHYCTAMLTANIGCESDADCFDANPCTTDTCTAGLCTNPANDAVNPNDGLFCNGIEDHCQNGQVIYTTPPPNCGDSLSCTSDSCNEATNQCDHILLPGKCLISGICREGSSNNPANGCQECNPFLDTTDWSPTPAGTACGDLNNSECDHVNTCDGAGVCLNNYEQAGEPCGNPASNTCTLPDICNGSGMCNPRDMANNTVCNDGNPCSLTDRCQLGICLGTGTPCSNPNLPFCFDTGGSFLCVQCLGDEDCVDDPQRCTGVACLSDVHTCFEFPDDVNCDDGMYCNGVEQCNGVTGQCGSGTSPCPVGQSCDENTNSCVACTTDAQCNDGMFCNGVERCVSNNCTAGTPTNCSFLNTTCTVGVCNESLDQCVMQPSNQGGVCNDGNSCTTQDVCTNGICVGGGPPPNCDDGIVCTNDTCHPTLGCQHANNTSPCNDNNPCTSNDVCSNGACVGTSTTDCNDNEVCTSDSCHPVLGCRHSNVSGPCNDNSVCTTNDTCFGGLCFGGQSINCNDNNACTADSCDPVLGCQRVNLSEPCDDGNGCTTNDVCSGGVCVGGPPPNCDDENLCTNDSCSGGNCQRVNNAVPCNDNILCTTDDRCGGGACTGTPVVCPIGQSCNPSTGLCQTCFGNADCNDNNPCTTDTCSSGMCAFTPNTQTCDDGNFCTINDRCNGGSCLGTAVICPPDQFCDGSDGQCVDCLTIAHCDDENLCTNDTCNDGTCVFTPNSQVCNDGTLCTIGDVCTGGTCRGFVVVCPLPDQECDPADGLCKECLGDADCNDDDACTDDACLENVCQHAEDPDRCDDEDSCTIDLCNPSTGACLHNRIECVYADIAPSNGRDCLVNVDDVLCAIEGFRNEARCPRADVYPCSPDGIITITDVLAVIETFEGHPPCPAPPQCP